MKLFYRLVGIVTALDFLRSVQALQATVRHHAPEGASQEEAIKATRDTPEVRAARGAMMRELMLFGIADLIVIGLILFWALA